MEKLPLPSGGGGHRWIGTDGPEDLLSGSHDQSRRRDHAESTNRLGPEPDLLIRRRNAGRDGQRLLGQTWNVTHQPSRAAGHQVDVHAAEALVVDLDLDGAR